MSTFDEQSRALVLAGGFLVEIAKDESLPVSLRQRAVMIARHFPTLGDVLLDAEYARFRSPAAVGASTATSAEIQSWIRDCPQGALTDSTTLGWPE